MPKIKKFAKASSPFRDGSRLERPNNASEALTMISYREQIVDKQKNRLARLQTEEIDLYIDACSAYIGDDFARLEDIKRAHAANLEQRFSTIDEIAHCLMEIRICKEFLEANKPQSDDNGEIRYKQGRLF